MQATAAEPDVMDDYELVPKYLVLKNGVRGTVPGTCHKVLPGKKLDSFGGIHFTSEELGWNALKNPGIMRSTLNFEY